MSTDSNTPAAMELQAAFESLIESETDPVKIGVVKHIMTLIDRQRKLAVTQQAHLAYYRDPREQPSCPLEGTPLESLTESERQQLIDDSQAKLDCMTRLQEEQEEYYQKIRSNLDEIYATKETIEEFYHDELAELGLDDK